MKFLLVLTSLLVCAVVLGAAGAGPAAVSYFEHDKVTKGGSLVTEPGYTVSVNRRTATGQVEVHEKETDIFYVTEGEATFVTGGKMIGGKVSRPNQLLGTDIDGGRSEERRVGK